jgi:hypothetical protein
MDGVNSTMIYCKNFCECCTTIKKKNAKEKEKRKKENTPYKKDLVGAGRVAQAVRELSQQT